MALRFGPLLAAVALLALVPGAAGCSFAYPGPPPPGRFYVWDLANEEILFTQDTWWPELHGDCSLSSLHDLEGSAFVYVDHAGPHAQAIYLKLLGSDHDPVRLHHAGRYTAVDLDADFVYAHVEGSSSVVKMDIAEGSPRAIPLGPALNGPLFIADGLVAWTPIAEDNSRLLSVFDARTETFVFDNLSFTGWGLSNRTAIAAADREWLILRSLGAETAYTAYRFADATLHPLSAFPYRAAIDAGYLYGSSLASNEVEASLLPDAAATATYAIERPMLPGSAVDQGRIVLGVYSVSAEEWTGATREPPAYLNWSLRDGGALLLPSSDPLPGTSKAESAPFEPLAILVAAMLFVAWARRRG